MCILLSQETTFLTKMYKAWSCFLPWVSAHRSSLLYSMLQPLRTLFCYSRKCPPSLWGCFICSAPWPLPSSSSPGYLPRILSVSLYWTLTFGRLGGLPVSSWCPTQLSVPRQPSAPCIPVATQVRTASLSDLLWAVPTALHVADECAKLFIKSSKRKEHGKWMQQVLRRHRFTLSFQYNVDDMPWNLTLVYISYPVVKLVSLSVVALHVAGPTDVEDLLYTFWAAKAGWWVIPPNTSSYHKRNVRKVI